MGAKEERTLCANRPPWLQLVADRALTQTDRQTDTSGRLRANSHIPDRDSAPVPSALPSSPALAPLWPGPSVHIRRARSSTNLCDTNRKKYINGNSRMQYPVIVFWQTVRQKSRSKKIRTKASQPPYFVIISQPLRNAIFLCPALSIICLIVCLPYLPFLVASLRCSELPPTLRVSQPSSSAPTSQPNKQAITKRSNGECRSS